MFERGKNVLLFQFRQGGGRAIGSGRRGWGCGNYCNGFVINGSGGGIADAGLGRGGEAELFGMNVAVFTA